MSATEQRKLSAIMFTDMVGYSALSQRNETLALELLEDHRKLLRELFPKFQGREVETIGDGFLVEFASALEAVRCAIEIQRTLATRNISAGVERRIELRIGLHVGDVVHRDGHVMGDGVNIAARLEPLAQPGGICVSLDVERQIRNSLEARFERLGPRALKNIAAPVELFRIVLPWEKEAPRSSTVGTETQPASVAGGRQRVGSIAIVLVVVLGLTWWIAHRHPRPSSTDSPAVRPTGAQHSPVDQKSVAVLPFVNMSADRADEYLSDGMTEELLNALARINGLHVPGRSSSFAFKGKNEEDIFRKVGEQLHVSTVLEGSVRKAGERLRITTQLINVADGFHLWSETYDRDMTNIFAIQSDIAARVAEALKVHLLGQAAARKNPTENLEAYKLYLRGRQLWNRRTAETITQAIGFFNRAIAADPSYALAYAALADAYATLSDYSGTPVRETVPKLRAAALKAIELDESLGEPHAALGISKSNMDWDWAGAEAELRRSIALNSNYATSHHWLALVFESQGRFSEALNEAKRAREIDPLSAVINAVHATVLFETGKQDMAVRSLQEQARLDPSFAMVQDRLGTFYLCLGAVPEAVAALEKAHQLDPENPAERADLGFAYARAGRTAEAQRALQELEGLKRKGWNVSMGIAFVQHGLGNDGQALDALEQAAEERADQLPELFYSPLWKDLRPHPRAQAILRRMNLVK